MIEIRLSNGATFVSEGVHANPVTYLGTTRDALTFTFDPETVGVDELLGQFTQKNCAAVTIADADGECFVHEHYTIRIGAGVSCRDLVVRSTVGGAVQETRPLAWVTMARSTEAERTLQAQQETIDALLVAALEGGAGNV